MSTINSDDHDEQHGGGERRALQPLALEHRDMPGASFCQQETPENSEVV